MTTKERAAVIAAIRSAIRVETDPLIARIDRLLARYGKVEPR